jgi:hypothetical protein
MREDISPPFDTPIILLDCLQWQINSPGAQALRNLR